MNQKVCQCCNGDGVVQPKVWRDYWEWFKTFRKQHKRSPNEYEDCAWWAARGCWKNDPQNPIPPEERVCQECKGTGVVKSEIELEKALQFIRF